MWVDRRGISLVITADKAVAMDLLRQLPAVSQWVLCSDGSLQWSMASSVCGQTLPCECIHGSCTVEAIGEHWQGGCIRHRVCQSGDET